MIKKLKEDEENKKYKKLQQGSILDKYDVDDDGIITNDEIQDIKEIEEIGQEYTRMKIEEDFGKNYIMGSATGGIGLDMEVQQLVDIGEDGEKEEYVDLYPVKDGRYII